jgi:hypothetical protein
LLSVQEIDMLAVAEREVLLGQLVGVLSAPARLVTSFQSAEIPAAAERTGRNKTKQ